MKREIKHVVLLEPRSPDLHIFSRFAMPRLGVVILGTILKERGYQVKVMVEDVAPFDHRTIAAADLVGISCITSTSTRGYELADSLRRERTPVVMGGPHVTHRAEEALDHCDYVVRGEGEAALPALIEAIERGEGFEKIAGLSYWRGGRTHHVPEAPFERDLDRWPDPDLSLIDTSRSRSMMGGWRYLPLMTSRGCPHDCSFCSVTTTFGQKMRYRSVDRVLAEVAKHDLRRTAFFIYDDNFTANRRRTRELLDGFCQMPVRPRWMAQVRADVARDTELLDHMARAGCNMVFIGLESVNEESLKSSKKRQTLVEVRQHVGRIRAAGINVHGMFVLGFDSDGPGTLERTVDYARELGLYSVQFLVLTPLPGTRLGDELEAAGRVLHHDWSKFDTLHVCFRPALVEPLELQRWQVEGHRRFYSLRHMAMHLRDRDWSGALVGLYAARMARRWQHRNQDYLGMLAQMSRPRDCRQNPSGLLQPEPRPEVVATGSPEIAPSKLPTPSPLSLAEVTRNH
jgi:radical SAM superfamily enzyme YgiQ (UPF0313 family)